MPDFNGETSWYMVMVGLGGGKRQY